METAVSAIPHSRFRSLFLLLLTSYLFLQAWHSDFERIFFWGEGIAFLLLFFGLKATYACEIQKKVILGVYAWIFIFPVYGILLSYFFWGEELNWYYLFRHLAYFYYALFFFGGYQWGPLILQGLARYWRILLFSVPFLTVFVGGSLGVLMVSGFVWLACQKGNPQKWLFYLIPSGFILFFGGSSNSTAKITSLMFLSAPVFVYLYRYWHLSPFARAGKYLFRFVLLLGSILLVISANKLVNLIYAVALSGGTFHSFFDEFSFTDMNGVWRIMLWSYLFDRFMQHPLGVGLGTPLMGMELWNFMYLIQKTGDEYTSGAHNSFITFLTRLGVPFLTFLTYMFFYTGRLVTRFFQRADFQVLGTAQKRFVFASFLTFLIGVIQACFNVVLESPLLAGLFWFNYGLFVRIAGDFSGKPNPIHGEI